MSKKVIEAEVEVISSKKSTKAKPETHQKTRATPSKQRQPQRRPNAQADNPFAAFGGANGMPDLSAMFGAGGMPDLSKMPGIPLKQRIIFKIMSLLGNPKLRFLKSKWSIPIWGLIAVVVVGLGLTVGLVFLVFKLLKALLNPYISLFKKK